MVRAFIDTMTPAPMAIATPFVRIMGILVTAAAVVGIAGASLVGCGAQECPEGVTPDPAGNCPIVDDTSPTATP